MPYDTKGLRQAVKISDTARRFGIKLERRRHEFVCLCPFHQEDTPSCSIYPAKKAAEMFYCFGCGEHGDVIHFTMGVKGVKLQDACEILGGNKDGPDNRPPVSAERAEDIYASLQPATITDLPEPGKPVRTFNPKSNRFSTVVPEMVHVYRSTAGDPLGVVVRLPRPGGKETPFLRMSQHGWTRWTYPQGQRPLYGLEQLA